MLMSRNLKVRGLKMRTAKKNSQFYEVFKEEFTNMRESGVHQRILRKYFVKMDVTDCFEKKVASPC